MANEIFVMSDEHESHLTLGDEPKKQLHHLIAGLGVETSAGFVGEEKPWFDHERARDRHALFFAAAELIRKMPKPMSEADTLERAL